INKFIKSVAKTEQPFGRVNSMFASAVARQRNITASALANVSVFASAGPSLRILTQSIVITPSIHVSVRHCGEGASRIRCLSLIHSSRNAKFPQQEAEAWIYHALFSMLLLSNSQAQGQSIDQATEASTRLLAVESLEECESLFSRYPGTLAYLRDDAEKARRLVNGGTFYNIVTTEEKREVYRAMARQFSGTGHWYYCRNNHPFTVGECGMPVAEARCPQCEEPIGGHNHTPAQGVHGAEELVIEFT
ncbi:hypothetical protein DM02DRAFT_710328, partial [Periconia macrospinosa]